VLSEERQPVAPETGREIEQNPVIPTEKSDSYYPGPLDYAAVEEFLNLLNPTFEEARICQLAASLAKKVESSSAVDLVRKAIEIQAEAKRAVRLRRDLVLGEMNFSTVDRLLVKLRCLDSLNSESEEGVVSEQGPYRSILSTVWERFKELQLDTTRAGWSGVRLPA
jgi:hypothetical protein